VTGNAVKKAAQEAKKMLLLSAAKEFEAGPEDCELRDRRIYLKETDKSISFARAIARHIRENGGDPIIGRGNFRGLKDAAIGPSLKNAKGAWSDSYAFDAQVAEVEVDMRTGKVTVVRALTAHDCGFPLNPLLVEGQIDGQVSMAAGQATVEDVIMKNGVTLNPSFLDYKVPLATEMIESSYIDIITEQYEREGRFITKEVGEGYVSGILAAITNAVANAVGFRAKKLPLNVDSVKSFTNRGDSE